MKVTPGTKEPDYPYVAKVLRADVLTAAIGRKPEDGVFPEVFLQEVASYSEFSTRIVIGLPECTVLPTVDYTDFCSLAQQPLT